MVRSGGTKGCTKGYRALAAGLLLPAILFLTPSPSTANIFGPDDRRDITLADNLSGIGTIVCEGTTRRPTAALVTLEGASPGIDVIATVAHAFLGSNEQRLTSCEFWPGGNPSLSARIAFLETGTLNPEGNWHNDWAVAVLDRRLPEELSRLVPRVLDEREAELKRRYHAHFLLAGHNGERGPLQVSEKCGPVAKKSSDLNRFDARVFNHDCDMMPGWSGGPLVLRENGTDYLVAVNSTEVNAITHISGRPYNGRMNPNTAVRVDGRFNEALERLLKSGPPGIAARCLVASMGDTPALPC
ncbi:hypothetical protein [Parvibaculum sp.]|jgi:protease YdgD|uniref:trypsin-like serine peptidase n=1 Tax=Parvibaculum sp. TaxID=2024848 RepID=UPI000C59044A|nr:hypothetical protein [Parvibaculum sp.]MAU59725.1 hypothetical protein [Parvibaculum sp.]MBO6667751.1 hypothetical protein [Parvibaculum sp.]MBO6693169.1 hypothetical protein [Parvibaculum sp.]MBO6715164.1 hypothetical protein [Parvibaculum sp.]|tara:strand:- start:1494 stop:2393 length:900 start_codon:yes stop_codon:yes gene_type:complete